MFRFLKTILRSTVLLAFLTGCDAERLPVKPVGPSQELPVEFDLDWRGTANTRGFLDETGTQVKTSFQNGDIIHILGVFETNALREDGSYETGKTTRYGALQYNGTTRNWTAVEGNQLTWPAIATKGNFKAYFVSGSTGVLTTDTPQLEKTLSEITPTTDPLQAETTEDIPYGHAVELKFTHICAWLVLKDMQPMVSESYFFSSDGVKDPVTKDPKTFNNAFRLTLGQDPDGTPTLDFNFIQVSYGQYGTVIAGKAQANESTDVQGNLITTGFVSYFLEPGYYEKFRLTYPSTTAETYPYMNYDFTTIPKDIGDGANTEPDLTGNQLYTLSVTKSPGVIITSPPSSEGWDESDRYVKVDVEKFLKSIHNGESYNENGTDILESTPNGTKLLVNVDFGFNNYAGFSPDFKPDVQTGSVFDGNLHYIQNLAAPLFRYNYGTVKNIGITTVTIEATSQDQKELGDEAKNRHGALCMWNRENATIDNVRVKDVTMTIHVVSELSSESGGSETHNLGCIVGSNTGTINDVALSGQFLLTIQPHEGNDVNSSVLAGGVAGQCAANGKISNVSPLEGVPTLTIVNTCKGDFGSFSIGGIVGESSGIISEVFLSSISIDNTQSVGVTSYIGGMAGLLTTSDVSTSWLASCVVGGRIKAGVTKPYQRLTSGSYIGGIAGAVLMVPVRDCRSAVSVYGATTADDKNVIYATGGGFGRIRTTENEKYDFQDLIAYGSVLSAPNASDVGMQNYVGNFAGLAPNGWKNLSWTEYVKNTLVHTFGNIDYIGGYQD